MPILVLKDLNLIKHMTIKNFDHFSDHKGFDESGIDLDILWSRNLFALKGF